MAEQMIPTDEETLWQALLQRDASYDGRVYFGVRSTGIYCRPTCPSRRPRREQVRFFLAWEEAEAAGFRACKRCQPRQAARPQADLVERACRLLEQPGKAPGLAELGRALGVSPFHLQRVFKSVTGVTPRQYAAAFRAQEFKQLVRDGQPVNTAAFAAGYGSSSRLYEVSQRQLGMTPGAYRRGGVGMVIQYSIVDCYLGRLLVAATQRGVCALSFGDSDQALEAFLRREYPAAEISRADQQMTAFMDALLAHLEGQRPDLDLPLDVQATAFQLQVWEALRRIPYGETRSYSDVAREIGRPTAVRAVAHACAAYPAAVVTPCHRVVRSDGSLAGYRWGLARKQALLERELSMAAERQAEPAHGD